WEGDTVIMGDFNEVRSKHERFGSTFNRQWAIAFNNFISSTCLIDLSLEGYAFTWAHKSASKMSKLDRYLISEGVLDLFPHLSALCLDRHLSDHRPILLRETNYDYGPFPFWFFHSWFAMEALKIDIKAWSKEANKRSNDRKINIQQNLSEVDKLIDQGKSNDEILIKRITLLNDLQELNNRNAMEISQKAKIRWSIGSDENSKYFHGIMNKKRSQLAIRGTLANGEWISKAHRVKNNLFTHFKKQFSPIQTPSICFDFTFQTRQSSYQVQDFERTVTYEEYWTTIDDDVFQAVRYFFVNGHFPRGCNSSFIALIPKIQDAKFVKDFRPISLIGSVYKIIAKILANKFCVVLPYLISDVQSAFVSNRQILDGPFILNELLSWCKFKKLNEMIFKVEFEKAFDSVKWDYLGEALKAFGISLNDSFMISHLFYADGVIFIGEWNNNNIKTLLSVLRCFYLASGLKINLHKSKLMEIGVSSNVVAAAASLIGYSILTTPFNYLDVKIDSNMSRITPWDDVISKVSSGLSKWKLKLLSIGGRLSLLKSVLTSIPLYHMSIFKVPIGVLNHLESIRRNFFYGVDGSDRMLAWIGWNMKNYGLLCSKVADLVLPNISDRWCWSLEGSQEFSVKSSSILIDNTIFPKAEFPTRWLRVVPIKMFHKDGLRRPEIYAGVIQEEAQKEWEHTLLQDSMGKELHELNKRLEQKEHLEFLRMVRVSVLNDALKSMYNAEKRGKRQWGLQLAGWVLKSELKRCFCLLKLGMKWVGPGAKLDFERRRQFEGLRHASKRKRTVYVVMQTVETGAMFHRSGKIVVELNGRLNKCGVISPQFDVGVKEIEPWTTRLLPSRQIRPFGYIVLTASAGIMDHEEARSENTMYKAQEMRGNMCDCC
nr:RNA-directed DNA polymerase, eukaryota [Tanacetum cinerariifolium]